MLFRNPPKAGSRDEAHIIMLKESDIMLQEKATCSSGTLDDYDNDRITEKARVDHILQDLDAELFKLEGIYCKTN